MVEKDEDGPSPKGSRKNRNSSGKIDQDTDSRETPIKESLTMRKIELLSEWLPYKMLKMVISD